MRTQWNTGCLYSTHGQRIVAQTIPGGAVFKDLDRMIDGFVSMKDEPDLPIILKARVQYAYDQGQYTAGYVEGRVQEIDAAIRALRWE